MSKSSELAIDKQNEDNERDFKLELQEAIDRAEYHYKDAQISLRQMKEALQDIKNALEGKPLPF